MSINKNKEMVNLLIHHIYASCKLSAKIHFFKSNHY